MNLKKNPHTSFPSNPCFFNHISTQHQHLNTSKPKETAMIMRSNKGCLTDLEHEKGIKHSKNQISAVDWKLEDKDREERPRYTGVFQLFKTLTKKI